MKAPPEFTAFLVDDEGTCRELTFQGSTREGVCAGIEWLDARGRFESASDDTGTDLQRPLRAALTALAEHREPRSATFTFVDDLGVVRRGLVFVAFSPDEAPFVEISFFPEDVNASGDVSASLTTWAETLRAELRARRYFFRYENASWVLGDVGRWSGVFCVSDAHDES